MQNLPVDGLAKFSSLLLFEGKKKKVPKGIRNHYSERNILFFTQSKMFLPTWETILDVVECWGN